MRLPDPADRGKKELLIILNDAEKKRKKLRRALSVKGSRIGGKRKKELSLARLLYGDGKKKGRGKGEVYFRLDWRRCLSAKGGKKRGPASGDLYVPPSSWKTMTEPFCRRNDGLEPATLNGKKKRKGKESGFRPMRPLRRPSM